MSSGGILVLDGSIAPEAGRRGAVLRPSPGAAPLVVREPDLVRLIHRDAAIAGSDVITAATADLHRRALARSGDARRAREWTAAALRLAAEAASEAQELDMPAMRLPNGAPRRLRIAGLLGPLEGAAFPGLAPDGSTSSAEHRTQAGLLAEHGAELLRIEGIGTIGESAAATAAATETGLETWSGVLLDRDGARLSGGEPLEAWLDAVEPLDPAALVVAAPTTGAAEEALGFLSARTDRRLGAHIAGSGGGASDTGSGASQVPSPAPAGHPAAEMPAREAASDLGEQAARLVSAGAMLLGPGEDGGPAWIAAIRRAADRASEARRERERLRRAAWLGWIAEGAERAGGGAALLLADDAAGAGPAPWLSDEPAAGGLAGGGSAFASLPGSFEWLVAPTAELPRLPRGRYGLVVSVGSAASGLVAALPDLLVPGGWLLFEADPDQASSLRGDERLSTVAPTRSAPPDGLPGWIARRRS